MFRFYFEYLNEGISIGTNLWLFSGNLEIYDIIIVLIFTDRYLLPAGLEKSHSLRKFSGWHNDIMKLQGGNYDNTTLWLPLPKCISLGISWNDVTEHVHKKFEYLHVKEKRTQKPLSFFYGQHFTKLKSH